MGSEHYFKLEQAVRRAAELECAASLQTLAFEPDTNASDLAFDQRRALDQPSNPLGGDGNVLRRDR